jgi:prevent-host-death family protein
MKKIGTRELKNRLSKYLNHVRAGETILVTDRGEPVARLIPAAPEGQPGKPVDEILRELEAAGHLRLGNGKFADFKPVRTKGKPASRIIVEERR